MADEKTIVTYNGATIATLEAGQTATLLCRGKRMSGNIVIDGACSVSYNSNAIATLEENKTATILCDNKIMIGDVVVTAKYKPALISPMIDLDGDTLTMTAMDDKTETFVILVNGVEMASVENTTELITFTIEGTTYQAVQGMTWEEWVGSKYNIDTYSIGDYANVYREGASVAYEKRGEYVYANDTIIEGYNYAHTITIA